MIPFPTTTKTASAVQTIWINGDQDGYNIFDNTQPGEATYGDVNHSDETNPVSLIVKVFPQITLEVGGASVDLNLQQVRAFVWPVTAPAPADYQSAHQLLWNYMHVGTHLQGFDFPGGEHRYLVGAHLDLADIPGQKENNFVGVWALYSGAGYNVYARYPFDAPALFFGVGP